MEKTWSFIGSATDNTEPIFEPEREYGARAGKFLLDEKITNIFIIIGIPAHIKGYHYLRMAIKLAAGNFEMVNSITTKLYPLVASHFNTTTCKVARAIRNAIEIAWNKGKIINLNTVFGLAVYGHNDKPSSGELIALLAEKMYLDGI